MINFPATAANDILRVIMMGWCVECSEHYQYVKVSLPVSCYLVSQVVQSLF